MASDTRQRSISSACSAEEDTARLDSSEASSPETVRRLHSPAGNPYEPTTSASEQSSGKFVRNSTLINEVSQWFSSSSPKPQQRGLLPGSTLSTDASHAFPEPGSDQKKGRGRPHDLRVGSGAHSSKLGTFSGVFVPTTLNVLSILMFLRFGFVLGQSGVLGMMGRLREISTWYSHYSFF